jgi:tRNA (guanine-N7-)-methyltransferase
MAFLHPDINFIALDFYNKGCIKTCKRIDKSGLTNVRVLRVEARSFIDVCIPAESLRMTIINCPDPWPKLRHRKRRLVNSAFVDYLSRFMRGGADFYFATDFVDYGLDVAGFMTVHDRFDNQLGPDAFRHHLEEYPVSKYMRRFLEMGQPIYYVHYRKKL